MMKKIISMNKMVCFIAILLSSAMIFIGVLFMNSNADLQGNARVINYTGIIRGGTQRLIKQELMYDSDDALITDLDDILSGLIHGDKDKNIIPIKQDEYQSILKEMEIDWRELKDEITKFRNGGNSDRLYELSEQYFVLANEAVHIAEIYTENAVQHSRELMIVVVLAFIFVVVLSSIFIYSQQKRKKKIVEIEESNRKRSEELAKQTQQLLVPINEMTELMYIADVNTYELLFINDAGKKLFHIDHYKGQKCYKMIHGLDKPCEFCSNAKLSFDETYTWEHTNTVVNRHYLLKDRLVDWEKRIVRMEIAFDITENLVKKNELENRIKRDNILVQCIRELYQNHQTVDAMNHILKLIGELFEAERAYVFYMENDEMSNIAEWCNKGVVPQIENLQHLPRKDYKWWFQLYDEQLNIVIKDVEELKGDRQAEYELLTSQKINRLILIPFEQYENFGGMIGLDDLKLEEFANAKKFLRTLSYFIMLAIRRNEDEKALYELSYIDTLTGFYNRNRYIQDIDEFAHKDDPVGVIFIDLNGLKEVNDHYGHDAGDALLIKCAQIIRNSIKDGNFYRVGGDEFVVICLSIDNVGLQNTIKKLKEDLNENDCEAAIGEQWSETCRSIKDTILFADEKMYGDKERFYQTHKASSRYRH